MSSYRNLTSHPSNTKKRQLEKQVGVFFNNTSIKIIAVNLPWMGLVLRQQSHLSQLLQHHGPQSPGIEPPG